LSKHTNDVRILEFTVPESLRKIGIRTPWK